MKANVSGADTTKGGQRPFDSNKLIYRTFTFTVLKYLALQGDSTFTREKTLKV